MEGYSIITGQTSVDLLLALFSIGILTYVYLSGRVHADHDSSAKSKPGVSYSNNLCPSSTMVRPNSSSPSPPGPWWQRHKSSVGNWLASILAWVAVILMALAMMSVLLGDS
jgi:hypothetical protein